MFVTDLARIKFGFLKVGNDGDIVKIHVTCRRFHKELGLVLSRVRTSNSS